MLSSLLEPHTTIDFPKVVARLLNHGCLVGEIDGHAWIGLGEGRRCERLETGRLSVYAPDFFLREATPWVVYDESYRLPAETLIDWLPAFVAPLAAPKWTSSPRAEFETAFADVKRRLADGSLLKAVPFIERRARDDFSVARRASLLLHALHRCVGQPLRAYGIWNEREGMVGTTPEALFEERARAAAPPSLSTMALAGTRTLDGGSLLDDPKERTEHRIVVEGMVERLAPLGRVVVGEIDELRLPTLAHLYTPIEVFPERDVAFAEWVAALHPTPAIGAWPKAEGWRWLNAQPNAGRRLRYGAPFGFVPSNRETGTCLVAIRNVQWADGEARLLAGGGIVAASQADREWREFNLKLDSIAGALGLSGNVGR